MGLGIHAAFYLRPYHSTTSDVNQRCQGLRRGHSQIRMRRIPSIGRLVLFPRRPGGPAGRMDQKIPDLDGKQRLDFVHAFLRYIREAGCLGAIEWTRGYYPQRALYRARFFPYFRAVDLCAWIFEPGLSFGKIKDVYEIQV